MPRGFASFDKEKLREIASRGGRIAHEKGVAHRWTKAEAKKYGRLGGRRKAKNDSIRIEKTPE